MSFNAQVDIEQWEAQRGNVAELIIPTVHVVRKSLQDVSDPDA